MAIIFNSLPPFAADMGVFPRDIGCECGKKYLLTNRENYGKMNKIKIFFGKGRNIMKQKWLALFLAMCLAFSTLWCLSGCTDEEEENSTDSASDELSDPLTPTAAVDAFSHQYITLLQGVVPAISETGFKPAGGVKTDWNINLSKLSTSEGDVMLPMEMTGTVISDLTSGLSKGDISLSLLAETMKVSLLGNLICLSEVDPEAWIEIMPEALDSEISFDLSAIEDIVEKINSFFTDETLQLSDASFSSCGETFAEGKKVALLLTGAQVNELFAPLFGDAMPEVNSMTYELLCADETEKQAVVMTVRMSFSEEGFSEVVLMQELLAVGNTFHTEASVMLGEDLSVTLSGQRTVTETGGEGELTVSLKLPKELPDADGVPQDFSLELTFTETKESTGVTVVDCMLTVSFKVDGVGVSLEVPFAIRYLVSETGVEFGFSVDSRIAGALDIALDASVRFASSEDTVSEKDLEGKKILIDEAESYTWLEKFSTTYPQIFALLFGGAEA